MVFPILPKTPLPSLSLSAAGLVALADLQTIAHRTALTGTSSWWDSLVLAPGLHYQQAADGVAGSDASGISAETSRAFDGGNANSGGGGKGVFGTEALPGGGFKNVRVTNPGMLLFLSRLGWGLAAIIALITSRLLNIYIIKQRTPPSPSAPSSPSSSKLTEYLIPLSPTLSVRMRGRAADLAALTTETYLLAKTAAQGYLEAAAKLTIYLVAVFSGNVSQAGNMALLVLLLGSAGLLGLSNGFMKGVKGKGRVARGQRPPRRETEDAVEWGSQQSQVGTVVRDPYPFEGSVEYI
ncbi:hypothetical protein K4K61_012717 [Colletotrichum sp. SAR11_59]|nr:hypothetical protein K4K59_009237 [Colletotrichum sp. SAR11_240]KAI8297601.1 hypothetical protein K4K61_012717 [Colletotrichum sp. SAR11_59]